MCKVFWKDRGEKKREGVAVFLKENSTVLERVAVPEESRTESIRLERRNNRGSSTLRNVFYRTPTRGKDLEEQICKKIRDW